MGNPCQILQGWSSVQESRFPLVPALAVLPGKVMCLTHYDNSSTFMHAQGCKDNSLSEQNQGMAFKYSFHIQDWVKISPE